MVRLCLPIHPSREQEHQMWIYCRELFIFIVYSEYKKWNSNALIERVYVVAYSYMR